MKSLVWLVSMILILGCASTSVYGNTEWVDMVSPINHSMWKSIAVADFNTDGIVDIVAANPDATEIFSDYSGLPVWIGQIYNGVYTQYYWGLSSGSESTGNSASLPYPDPGNSAQPHVSCIYNGNTCNMMAEWTMSIFRKAGIWELNVMAGDSNFDAVIPEGISWRDVYHIDWDYWTFSQIGDSNDFSVHSEKYGNQATLMTLGTVYSSDLNEITLLVDRRVTDEQNRTGEKFRIETNPALARISAHYRDFPYSGDPRFIMDSDLNILIKPGKWFQDRNSLMKVRWDPKALDDPVSPGQSWHFHTPDGPLTNKAYNSVKVADINHDGQMDLIAAGPTGIDIFQQTGPSISEVGFIPAKPDQPGAYNNNLNVALGDINGYINPAIIYDEFYELVYRESDDGFTVRGLFTGAGGDFYPRGAEEIKSTYCHEVTFFGVTGGPWENNDRFTFSTKRVNWGPRTGPSTTDSFTDMVLGDITNNGWIDIIAARSSGGFEFFKYDGQDWVIGTGISFDGVISSILLEDLDRDGWKDLVASSSQGVHVWKGFPDGTWSTDFGPVASGRSFLGVSAGDFNKDGYFDIAATENLSDSTGSIEIWYLSSDGEWFQKARASTPTADPNNIGTGFLSVVKVSNAVTISEAWTLVCESAIPDGGWFKVQGSRSGVQSQYAIVGEPFTSDAGQIQFTIFDGPIDYALNDKFTFFTGRGPLDLKKFGAISTADLNNDGNLDLFTTSLDNFGVAVWHGNGHYGWKADTPPESSTSWQALTSHTDLNFDGNPDIIAGSYSNSGAAGTGVKIWVGKHTSENTWTDWIYKSLLNGKFNKIAHGDLNHDGELDLVLACSEQTEEGIWVLLGNGLGEFEKVPNQVTSKKGYFSVCTADFNLDGLSDIAAGRTSGGFDVFLTEESMTWGSSTSSITSGEVYDITSGDIDRDGKLDVVIAQHYIDSDQTGVVVYLNDGNGNFTSSKKIALPPSIFLHWSVDLADLDQNGLLDIITTNTSGNPGTMIFYGFRTESGDLDYNYVISYVDSAGLDHYYGLVANDFNLDGRPDFVVGEDGHGGTGYIGYTGITLNCLFGFNGAGYGKHRDIASSDLNNDGYPDLVIATEQNGVQASLTSPGYPGYASFGFNAIKAPASDGDYVGITVADFTNDGLDDVIASRNQSSGVSGLDMWISARDFSLAKVNGTFPPNSGQFNIGADTAVYIYFSKSMDPTTLTYENIQMFRDDTPIAYSIVNENDNRNVRLTPSEFIRHAKYSITVVGGFEGVRDSAGNMFDGNFDGQAQESPIDDYILTFTTIDRVPPSIPIGLSVTPGDAQVTMRWLSNDDPILDIDLRGYYVIWQLADDSEPQNYKFYEKEQLGLPPRITIRGLTNNLEYKFSLTSMDNDNNESAYSAKVKSTPLPERPQIWWAGMYDTLITSSEGGDLTILAYVIDFQGDNQSVELYYDDLPTGVFLTDGGHPDFPSGLGLYALYAPTGPLHSGYLQIPFQLIATDAAGNQSMMWPYYHVQKDIPGTGTSTSGFASMDRYFKLKNQEFTRKTEISFTTREAPSTSPDRPQILCAGFTAHPEADFEFGTRHWMTAIIIDPNSTADYDDISYVELIYDGKSFPFVNEGTVNEGKADQLDLSAVIWGIGMTWFGEQTDPDGPDGLNHYPAGPQFVEIQAVDREGNASDIWPNFTIN